MTCSRCSTQNFDGLTFAASSSIRLGANRQTRVRDWLGSASQGTPFLERTVKLEAEQIQAQGIEAYVALGAEAYERRPYDLRSEEKRRENPRQYSAPVLVAMEQKLRTPEGRRHQSLFSCWANSLVTIAWPFSKLLRAAELKEPVEKATCFPDQMSKLPFSSASNPTGS
jgi:hypothetical protein